MKPNKPFLPAESKLAETVNGEGVTTVIVSLVLQSKRSGFKPIMHIYPSKSLRAGSLSGLVIDVQASDSKQQQTRLGRRHPDS